MACSRKAFEEKNFFPQKNSSDVRFEVCFVDPKKMESFHCKTKTAHLCKTSFPLGRSCFRDFLLLGKNLTRNILWTSFEVKKKRISEEYTPRLKISVFCGSGKNFQEFLFKIKNGRPVYLVFVSKTVTFFRLFQSWYEVGMNCPSHV